MFLFDFRWVESGGIGRFCKEIAISDTVKKCHFLNGSLSEALSIKDLFLLSNQTLRGNFFVSPGYNCPLFSAGKAIITLHDLMHLNFPEYSGVKNRIYYEFIVKRAIKNAPLVFTVSEFTRKEISTWANVSVQKIAVVANGVNHKYYHRDVKPIDKKRKYFIYVGNNKTHKNLHRLIHAFALSGLSKKFDLLLSCSATAELTQLVMSLGLESTAIFLGGIDEVLLPSYYKGAVATVVVSLYEGFCLPILESMAVGTPVITSNITAMPETAGGAAILVDPYSIESICSALITLERDGSEQVRLSEAGLIRAKQFSWDISRQCWDQALTPILDIK